MHFNENSRRAHAHTKDMKARYYIVFPKYKKGEYTLRKILVDCTYDYVENLIITVLRMAQVSSINEDGLGLRVDVPPPLCRFNDRPDKDVAAQDLLSRFNRYPPHESQHNYGHHLGMQSESSEEHMLE